MNLYFREAQRLECRRRAATIQDINAGTNGGKDAAELIQRLLNQ